MKDNQTGFRCHREMDRRVFLKTGSAVGLAAFASNLLPQSAALASEPIKGGHLRLGMGHGSTSDSTDPATSGGAVTSVLDKTTRNSLTEVNSSQDLVPELAEAYEADPSAKVWVFDLRKGVEFHNGKTLTVDDVIGSINHHRGEDSKSALKVFAEQIDDMKKDTDHRIVFTLKEPNADFPFVVSDFGIMPADGEGKADISGVGNGGYILEHFEPGVTAVLKRNPNFYKDSGANFDSAEIVSILDTTARQNALITGEIDIGDKIQRKTAHLMEREDNVVVLDVPALLHYTFPMRTDMAPFDNNDVRLALKHAIDRDEVVKKVLRGRGTVGNDHPVSVINQYFASDLPQRTFDPDKAKFHLKKSGMDGLSVELSASEAIWDGAVDTIQLYRESAARAGIDVKVNRVPNDGYWSDVWMQHPWCASFWSGRPTEDWMFSAAYADDSSWNESYWKHERFNMLLREARGEIDDSKRREMYGEMQLIVRDEGGTVIPAFANHLIGHSTKISHGEAVAGNWDLDGFKIIERWWFS